MHPWHIIYQKVIIINRGNLITIDTPANLEAKVKSERALLVTVEDPENKIQETVKAIKEANEIKEIKQLPDGTKQYSITSKDDADIRKEIFEKFAKNGITIFELKQSEATLEEAFLGLIDSQVVPQEKTKYDIKKEKKAEKERKKQEKQDSKMNKAATKETPKKETKKEEPKKEKTKKGGDK